MGRTLWTVVLGAFALAACAGDAPPAGSPNGPGPGATLDRDGDTIADASDNCPEVANTDQADADGDRAGNACDADDDGDGVGDASDNCPTEANADQADLDTDLAGDACDLDDDGDAIADGQDNCPRAENPNQQDVDRDGRGDACDSDFTCPPYHAFCHGACVNTHSDPAHCGGCDSACPGAEACSAGACRSSCLPGLSVCGNRCVDLDTDSAHCGQCGRACNAGQGCVNGDCRPAAVLGDPPSKCEGGGPAIVVPTTGGGEDRCAAQEAQITFRWGLCSCGDVTLSNPILTDAFESTRGPYTPGELGSGVGLNGRFQSTSEVDLFGALWASATGGVRLTNPTRVRQELHAGGPFELENSTAAMDASAFVAGDVTARPGARITIAGDLHFPSSANISGDVQYANPVQEEVVVAAPCDRCDTGKIDVSAIVSARAANNDNALVGLDPALLSGSGGPERLDLPCGHYYLSEIDVDRPVSIVAHGRTALYVGGDVRSNAPLQIRPAAGAELDVFIGGDVAVTGETTLGSADAPALMRFYVGGAGELHITDKVRIGGFLYAANGTIASTNDLEVFGGVYAGEFRNTGRTAVHYDRQVLRQGDAECPSGGGGGGGGDPPECTSCSDCGNQACVAGRCGDCTSSGQCCSPLVCSGGRCTVVID